MFKFTEKCFYIVLITILVILAILLPTIIINVTKESSSYIYVTTPNDNSSQALNADLREHTEEYVDKYYTYNELSKYLEDFVNYRSIVFSKTDIGKTQKEKNLIHEVILEKKSESKPMVLIVSGIKANDWDSVLTSIEIMNRLYLDVGRTSNLLEEFSFHFIPLLNPDGYEFSMSLPIYSNWEYNYEGMANSKPQGSDILNDYHKTDHPHESALFLKYLENQDETKALFFLFSPTTAEFKKRSVAIPKEYFQNNDRKLNLIDSFVKAMEQERKNHFAFKIIEGPYTGRIDQYIVKNSQHPVLVVDLLDNYRPGPPDSLRSRIKEKGAEAHFIITRFIGLLPTLEKN